MSTPDLAKLRRLSLLLASILITYSFAGLNIDALAKVQVLGFPLIIRRPDFLPIGLLLGSVYCTIRYIYYGYLVNISPTQARFILRRGKPVYAPTMGISLENFIDQVSKEIKRYFPSSGKIEATCSQGTQCSVNIKVPKIVWALSLLEDIDYALPIIANLMAIAVWIIFT